MFAIFPEILQQAEKGDREAVAVLVRKYFGEQQIYLPNLRVADLCANAAIELHFDLDRCAARLEAWDAKGQFRIKVSIHPEVRGLREQNYILAHMLGHVFLDLQPKMAKGELQRTIFEKKQSPLRTLLLDPGSAAPVDDFACSLLLPRGMLKKAMTSLSSRKDVAAFFNVDVPLLEYRLSRIGWFGAESSAAAAKSPPNAKPASTPRPAREPSPAVEAKKTAPESTVATQKERPKAPDQSTAESSQDLSSLARVTRSVAARSYKKEDERSETSSAPRKSPGMERLRQLARKIDKSVDE